MIIKFDKFLLILVLLAGVSVACRSDGGSVMSSGTPSPEASVVVTVSPTTVLTSTVTPAPTSTASAVPDPTLPVTSLDTNDLRGFMLPIPGVCLPTNSQVMPNASRAYRKGVHEGVDFYNGDVCVEIKAGTPVLAAYAGVIIRADIDYESPTRDDFVRVAALISSRGEGDPESLDFYRGRQVWISHGSGVVTRYAHLGGITEGLTVGVSVKGGELIGYVGESGTPESVVNPNTENHLHFEVRINDGFLGENLEIEDVRAAYELLFSIAR